MAFRTPTLAELCSVCRAPTQQRCLRCGKPLCSRHEPEPGTRCASCEQELEARRRPLMVWAKVTPAAPTPRAPRTWLLLVTTAAVIVTLVVTLSADVFFALLLGAPMLCLAGVELARSAAERTYRHRLREESLLRRRFLAERKPYLGIGDAGHLAR